MELSAQRKSVCGNEFSPVPVESLAGGRFLVIRDVRAVASGNELRIFLCAFPGGC